MTLCPASVPGRGPPGQAATPPTPCGPALPREPSAESATSADADVNLARSSWRSAGSATSSRPSPHATRAADAEANDSRGAFGAEDDTIVRPESALSASRRHHETPKQCSRHEATWDARQESGANSGCRRGLGRQQVLSNPAAGGLSSAVGARRPQTRCRSGIGELQVSAEDLISDLGQ
jgi:hypothetical protein